MSKETAPTKPILLSPTGGEEISNLNTTMDIRWESTDVPYYAEARWYSSGLYGDKTSLSDSVWIGQLFRWDSLARIGYIELDLQGQGLVYAELVKVTSISEIDRDYAQPRGSVTYGEVIYGANLDSNRRLHLPLDLAKKYTGYLAIRAKKLESTTIQWNKEYGIGGNDIELPTGFTPLGRTNGDFYYEDHDSNRIKIAPLVSHPDDILYTIELSTDNGQKWEHIISVVREKQYTLDFSSYIGEVETYQAKLRIRANDNDSVANWTDIQEVIYTYPNNFSEWTVMETPFTIVEHLNPTEPTNLRSNDKSIIDRTLTNRLSWKHNVSAINNRQGKAVIQWRKQGTSTWNELSVDGMNQFYDVPGNTFPTGTIEWRVKTYSYVFMESPYSAISTFTAKDTPQGPIILAPDLLVNEPSPAVSWEHDYIQTHYEIVISDESDNVEWNSGQVESESTASTVSVYLTNLATYKAEVRVKTNEGLWTAYTAKLFNTDYQFPAQAYVTATANNEGFITVSYQNPEPTGEQPIVARNEVYKKIDNEWVKISDAAPHSFDDYAAAHMVTNHYFVRSIASNGSYTDSNIVSATVRVRGVVLYLVNNPAGTIKQFRKDGHGRSQSWSLESGQMNFKGRKYPVVEVGTMQENVIDFTLVLDESEKQALDDIVYSGHICCYRDGRGRILHGIFTEYNLTDERWGGYTTDLSLMKIDYVEGETFIEDDGITNVVIDGGEF
jgi:hypothetical protein